MNFAENLRNTLNNGEFNESVTENGAVGYRTTGKNLLDINFSITSLRNRTEREIVDMFIKAYYENPMLAVKWLFYAGDVRGGIGERRLFKTCFKYLAENHKEIGEALLDLVPEYTRWDNILVLIGTPLEGKMIDLIEKQLEEDIKNMNDKKPISLLAKWLPSINTSSAETRAKARKIIGGLQVVTESEYRKTLSKLRAYLKVVETLMSSNQWYKINYANVPSRANLIYNNAFLRRDETRRRAYLSKVEEGSAKINAGVLFPHDIVHKYTQGGWSVRGYEDSTLEELWKALPDYVKGAGNTICVADGSGSMCTRVGNTNVTCIDVANALAIYFAERSSGEFKNQYITFSENPRFVNFSGCKTLKDKIELALSYDECANTNIEKVFDLILETAVRYHMKQEDIPKNILILSDMEFDSCATSGESKRNGWYYSLNRPTKKLFDVIGKKYEQLGYKLPRLVFWNICSRTGTVPVKENDLGVALVSGFSPAIMNMVLSSKLDPFDCLVDQLNSERYAPVEERIKNII